MNPLFAVRDALRTHGVTTSTRLAAELGLPGGVVDDALDHWLRRGYAQQVSLAGGGCGTGCNSGCGTCAVAMQGTAYRWQERERPLQLHRALAREPVQHEEGANGMGPMAAENK